MVIKERKIVLNFKRPMMFIKTIVAIDIFVQTFRISYFWVIVKWVGYIASFYSDNLEA